MNHNLLNGVFLSSDNNRIYLEILVDRNSVEIYANHGRLYVASAEISIENQKQPVLFSQGKTLLNNLEIYELKSIWDQ